MEVVKEGSKYFPLFELLQKSTEDRLEMTFQEIEAILGRPLPKSARRSNAFWSNRSKGALQAKAWMSAGYHVQGVDLDSGIVTFHKPDTDYHVQRDGDTILWNGSMIRALRRYLGVNQADFSELLGVRQQTVSEWENLVYQPTRSRSKHLTIVAERAGFAFKTDTDK
jgi:DNA-binding transcriptional regulator YiaG